MAPAFDAALGALEQFGTERLGEHLTAAGASADVTDRRNRAVTAMLRKDRTL